MDIDGIVADISCDLPHALIALDFDGTLAPLVPDPLASRPTDGTTAVLTALADAGAEIAVITGRDARTVQELGGFSSLRALTIVGLYGIETLRDGRLTTIDTPPAIETLRERLPEVVAKHRISEQVWVEDKRLSLVVHTRRAPDPGMEQERLREPVARLAYELGLETHDGRMVIEVRLPGFDKGSALEALVGRTQPTAVLFAGDDIGDLPAFTVTRRLRTQGVRAWGVAAGSPPPAEVSEAADAVVGGPVDVVAVLRQLLARAD
ncbi:MAG: trehalose-phosphatase [Actinomycetota bacterium]|nr:trehalose-phosphatase [Actinomycetota bacterium]